MDAFRKSLGWVDETRVKFMVCQEEEDEIEKGVKLLCEIAEVMRRDKREEDDISCLKVGLKCGGSDGLSGITANPLVGRFSDYIVSAGGTTVLTEVPEMFGAEQLLNEQSARRGRLQYDGKTYKQFQGLFQKQRTEPSMKTLPPATKRAV